MYVYQFLGMQHVAEMNGWTKFVSMQNYYNLLYREEEREMLPACLETGVGYSFRLKLLIQCHSLVSHRKRRPRKAGGFVFFAIRDRRFPPCPWAQAGT